jgi:hypothetical protein
VPALNQQTAIAESGLYSTLYGEEAGSTEATGQAQSLNIEAQGTAAEAGEYGTAASISGQNAQIAAVSGQLEEYQQNRELMNTIGTQKAQISGAGFQEAGSALSLATSSMRQGLLQQQATGVNTQLEMGGYLEQAQASVAEESAANTASATEAASAATAASVSQQYGAEEATTKAFMQNMGVNPNASPAQVAAGENTTTPTGGGAAYTVGGVPTAHITI